MTPKQKLFIKEYLIDLNATRAAISAGYSEKTACEQGSRLLRNVQIQAEVNKSSEKRAKKLDISAEYVLETVHDTVERCRQARPVLNREGQPVLVDTPAGSLAAAYVFRPDQVLKGCELLGKHLRVFGDEDRSTKIPVQIITNILLPNANA